MNKIRLVAFLTGFVLIIIGIAKILTLQNGVTSVYSPAVLIIIGAMMILAVRKK